MAQPPLLSRRGNLALKPASETFKMRIALIGYGKMGREIEAIARDQPKTIRARVDSKPARCG